MAPAHEQIRDIAGVSPAYVPGNVADQLERVAVDGSALGVDIIKIGVLKKRRTPKNSCAICSCTKFLVKSLLLDFVPEDFVRDFDFDTLETCSGSYTSIDLRQRHDNIVWHLRWKDTWCYVYILLEFQSAQDYWMGLRIATYTDLLWLHFEMPKVDNQKTEVLTDEQLKRFLDALAQEPNQDAAALIRLAMVTGMRKGALLALRWDDCDFERNIITLRGDSAKKGKTDHIPMTPAARSVLESIQDRSSEYVFPGKNGGQRKDYRRIANRVKRKAALPEDFRPLHGLRHNFASRLASSGQVELYTLQKLLTHSSPQMTQRYAHLRDETLMRAARLADSMLMPDVSQNHENKE